MTTIEIITLTVGIIVALIAGALAGRYEARKVAQDAKDYDGRTDLLPEDAALRDLARVDREISSDL